MKRLIFAVTLAVAASSVMAGEPWETTRAAQVAVSVAEQIRIAHHGDYADLGTGQETVTLPWGPLVAYSAKAFPDIRHTTRNFGLNINGIPAGDDPTCVRFALAVAPHFSDVWIGDDTPTGVGASVYTRGHLDRARLEQACHAHPSVGMDLITH